MPSLPDVHFVMTLELSERQAAALKEALTGAFDAYAWKRAKAKLTDRVKQSFFQYQMKVVRLVLKEIEKADQVVQQKKEASRGVQHAEG